MLRLLCCPADCCSCCSAPLCHFAETFEVVTDDGVLLFSKLATGVVPAMSQIVERVRQHFADTQPPTFNVTAVHVPPPTAEQRAAAEREAAQQKRQRRQKQLLIGAGVATLSLAAIAGGVWAWRTLRVRRSAADS